MPLEYFSVKCLKPLLSRINLFAFCLTAFRSSTAAKSRYWCIFLPVWLVRMLQLLFVTLVKLLSTFSCIGIRSTLFSRGTSLVITSSHVPWSLYLMHTRWNGLIKNYLQIPNYKLFVDIALSLSIVLLSSTWQEWNYLAIVVS